MRQLFSRRRFGWALHSLAAVLLILSAVFLGRLFATQAELDLTVNPMMVAVMPVKMESGHFEQRSFTGRAQPRRSAMLAFERSARVTEIGPYAGEEVRAGQVLARQFTADLEAIRAEREARLKTAEAELSELVRGPREEVIRAARAELTALEAELAFARWRAERRLALAQKAAASEEDTAGAGFAVKTLEARKEAAAARLAELLAGTRDEQIAAAKAKVLALRASLDAMLVEIARAELVAPFAGRILRRAVDVGAVAVPGAPVFELIESSHLEARIGVPTPFLGAIDADVRLMVGQGPREVSARGLRLEAELDRDTRQAIWVLSLDPAADVLPGELVRLSLPRRTEESGAWLPISALTRDLRGLWAVYAVKGTPDDALVHVCAVEILATQDDRVYVRGTIQDGDRVVLAGLQRVVPGQRVRWMEEAQ